MLCGISGEVPEEPVVSKKTGIIYEKRLILKYIEDNQGKGPGAEDELDPEDLLDLKTSRVVRPRPPNFTSLPSLLKAFQDEWDALVLGQYNIQEELARTREELATALYQHDAAVRVIARLTRERDEARDALSKVTVTGAAREIDNGEAMQLDSEALPEDWIEHVDEVHHRLTKSRKKRPIPQGWATADEITAFAQISTNSLPAAKASSLAVDGAVAVVGSLDGKGVVYSIENDKVEMEVEVGEPVTDLLRVDDHALFGTSTGSVKMYLDGKHVQSSSEHAGVVSGLALHPGHKIFASVGVDKAVVFYVFETLARVSRFYTDSALTCCAFHPDGHLFAAGTQSGEVKVFDSKTGQQAASFAVGAPVQALVFSENGFWFAATGKGQTTVTVFDLRKDGDAARAKELQTGDARALAWDYTGQFLATTGQQGVTVQQYAKSSKSWSEPLRTSNTAVAVRWGPEAKSLVAVNHEGVVSVMGVKQ